MSDKTYKIANLLLHTVNILCLVIILVGGYLLLKLHDIPDFDEAEPYICFAISEGNEIKESEKI